MKKFIVLASAALTAMAALGGSTVSGRISIAPRRGPAPALNETLVWLEPVAPVKGRKPEHAVLTTRAKTLVPHILAIPVGSTVQFPNDDPILHNLFSISSPNNFDLGLYRRNAGKSRRFDSSGIVNVYCNVHPGMSAVIHVMSSPWYTFADSSGAYSLEGVPPGKYKLVAWNETGGSSDVALEVTGSGELRGATAVMLDGKSFRVPQHLNKFGQPYSRSSDGY